MKISSMMFVLPKLLVVVELVGQRWDPVGVHVFLRNIMSCRRENMHVLPARLCSKGPHGIFAAVCYPGLACPLRS